MVDHNCLPDAPRAHKPQAFPASENLVSEMFRITLPDGSVREVAPGATPADIAGNAQTPPIQLKVLPKNLALHGL